LENHVWDPCDKASAAVAAELLGILVLALDH
jgi:hypothetical protein